jgi:hypothetical protein
MFDATITRDHKFPDCILSSFIAKGEQFYTLERPWLSNVSDISCIPTGAYELELDETKIIGECPVYRFKSVPGRSGILLHVGNYVTDSHGCPLIGLGRALGTKCIISSRHAMAKLIRLMGKKFTLSIGEVV